MRDRLLTIVLSVAATYGLMKAEGQSGSNRVLDVDRLIVREELIVSDTGSPWEKGFETQQIPRGIYARPVSKGVGGLWVRSRLIKGELDDPFDDRFHALERTGAFRGAPGHISWNVWLDGAWRQMAIVQGEAVELSEMPRERWNGSNHPGRLRFQSFRPDHPEPLTDALIGQGGLSLGGGGFGGGGLPPARNGLDLWGGRLVEHALETPRAPRIASDDGSGPHAYTIAAVGSFGMRTMPSPAAKAAGKATIEWESVAGADGYVVERDGRPVSHLLRIEGATKRWADPERK